MCFGEGWCFAVRASDQERTFCLETMSVIMKLCAETRIRDHDITAKGVMRPRLGSGMRHAAKPYSWATQRDTASTIGSSRDTRVHRGLPSISGCQVAFVRVWSRPKSTPASIYNISYPSPCLMTGFGKSNLGTTGWHEGPESHEPTCGMGWGAARKTLLLRMYKEIKPAVRFALVNQ